MSKITLSFAAFLLLIASGAFALEAPAPVDSTIHGVDFKEDCARCHTPDDWRTLRDEIDYDHATTGFELDGAHVDATCKQCHADPVFANIGVLCADCHRDVVHRGELGFDCGRCHEPHDWRASAALQLEHQQTRFPLMGRHALMDCEACHTDVQHDEFVGLNTECFGCHAADYHDSRAPNHGVMHFSTDCQRCHSAAHVSWDDVAFMHTGSFPLSGGHAGGECGLCHTESSPYPDGQNCFGCHDADYDGDHASDGFPTDCRLCHDPDGFDADQGYAHVNSGFPGYGGHAETACYFCHASGMYAGMPSHCSLCHMDEYDDVFGPDHAYPTTCENCHTPAGWGEVLRTSWEESR